MKRTFPANINGAIFYIDEDAYNMLNNYFDQLREAFPGDEGDEIVPDIEARIAEHFSEILQSGSTVITIDNVNSVIEKVGRPADLSDTPEAEPASESSATPPPFRGVAKKLYRNMQNKVFGGVLGGAACYFGWNANILRLLVIILALFTYVWPLVIAYLIAWMVIPAAITPRQILEMKGTPVTVGNVGQTVLGTADPGAPDRGAGLMAAFGKLIIIFLGAIAALFAIGALVMFIKLLCGLIVLWGWDSYALLDELHFGPARMNMTSAIGAVLIALAVALPCIAAVWGACAAIFKVRGISRPILISGIILELLLIIAGTVLISVGAIPPVIRIESAMTTFALSAACN